MQNPKTPVRFPRRLNMILGLALLWALLSLSGCGRVQPPAMHYPPDEMPVSFRREPLHPNLDYVHNFSEKVYDERTRPLRWWLSRDERMTIEEMGQPDYLRDPFRTTYGEKVKEWLYLEENQVVQFIDGERVFTGPVRDLERLLLRRGRPFRTLGVSEETGINRMTYFYRDVRGDTVEMYSFSNGELLHKVD